MKRLDTYYILDGHDAVPCNMERWSVWFQDADRRVALTETSLFTISTVFLGMDHSFGTGGDPLIFETMVFDKGSTNEAENVPFDTCVLYSTWDEAEEGHQTMVGMVHMVEDFAKAHLK